LNLGTPPEEKKEREITTITSVASINSLDVECVNLCEEITWFWTKLAKDMEMKVVKEKLRNA
jgi:hypothetical protein